jgi:hypothetical protein
VSFERNPNHGLKARVARSTQRQSQMLQLNARSASSTSTAHSMFFLVAVIMYTCFTQAVEGTEHHDGRVQAFSVPTPENSRDYAPRSILRAVPALDFSQADLDLQPNPKEWLSPSTYAYKSERQEAGTAPTDCSDLLANATKQEDGTYIIWNPAVPWLPPRNGVQV